MRVPKNYATAERGDMPLNGGFGETKIEVLDLLPEDDGSKSKPLRIRLSDVPEDSIATSPDEAAVAAAAMQSLSHGHRGIVGFRVEYRAD